MFLLRLSLLFAFFSAAAAISQFGTGHGDADVSFHKPESDSSAPNLAYSMNPYGPYHQQYPSPYNFGVGMLAQSLFGECFEPVSLYHTSLVKFEMSQVHIPLCPSRQAESTRASLSHPSHRGTKTKSATTMASLAKSARRIRTSSAEPSSTTLISASILATT
jgi:hypothetical protein